MALKTPCRFELYHAGAPIRRAGHGLGEENCEATAQQNSITVVLALPLIFLLLLSFSSPRSTLAVPPAVFTVPPFHSLVSPSSALASSFFSLVLRQQASSQFLKLCGRALQFPHRTQKDQPNLETLYLLQLKPSPSLILPGSRPGMGVLYRNMTGVRKQVPPNLLDRTDELRKKQQ